MPAAVRYQDVCTGHGCFGPRPNNSASNNVYINSRGAHRVSDTWAVHCCGPSCHSSAQQDGSPNIFINGLKLARVGDPIACGSLNATGSPNVIAN